MHGRCRNHPSLCRTATPHFSAEAREASHSPGSRVFFSNFFFRCSRSRPCRSEVFLIVKRKCNNCKRPRYLGNKSKPTQTTSKNHNHLQNSYTKPGSKSKCRYITYAAQKAAKKFCSQGTHVSFQPIKQSHVKPSFMAARKARDTGHDPNLVCIECLYTPCFVCHTCDTRAHSIVEKKTRMTNSI